MTMRAKIIAVVVCIYVLVLYHFSIVFYYTGTNADSPDNFSVPKLSAITEDEISWTDIPPQPPYPIDIIYTWAGPTKVKHEHDQRNRDNGELKYSLRSIYQHLSWFNHIYIVVSIINIKLIKNNSTFLKPNHPNVTFISHADIFKNRENTIDQENSDAIEANIHRIPNLSDYYIYINDDFFIGRKLSYQYFFIYDGIQNRLVPRLPHLIYLYNAIGEPWWNKLKHWNANLTPYKDTFCDSDLIKWRLNISDIPFDNNLSMMRHGMEHMPHPYYKPDIERVQDIYFKLFQVIESNKRRFHNCNRHYVSPEKHYVRLWLNGTFKYNQIYRSYWDYPYELYIKYIHRSGVTRSFYYYFVSHSSIKDLDQFKYHLNQIKRKRSATFCINDDYPADNHQHLEVFAQFMQEYFPHKSPLEK